MSLKVIHIIPTLQKGGAERLVIDIVREMSKSKDFDVRLIIFRNKIEYEVNDILHLIEVIPSSVHLSLIKKNRLNTTQLQSFINQFKPDIIHSHLFEAEIVSRSCLYFGAKWFSHGHDNMRQLECFKASHLLNKTALTSFFEKQYLISRYRKNGGNQFIAISKNTLDYLLRVLPKSLSNVVLLHNAINVRNFKKPKDNFRVLEYDMELVTVGSLVYNKNQSFLLEVVSILVKNGINVILNVLGSGPNITQLLEKSTQLNIEKHISFRGNVGNVSNYLWRSDFYVHSAFSEAFGLVFLEAMAAGLPVVSLDGGGNRDIVRDGFNGYIVLNDPILFAEKISTIYNTPSLYRELSENAAKFALNFDIKLYVEKLVSLYKGAQKTH